jgi:3-hydroxyacyl-CoA dehydrogenase
MQIRKVGVLGAGVMGSGIAAHIANAGYTVELLDLKDEWSAGSIKKALKAKPAPFMDKRYAKRIRTGNFDEHMGRIADCDWVVEVVTEDAGIKQALYEKVLPHLSDTALFTSNTSGIPLSTLTEGFPDDVKKRFFITHFFNPPRYMRLLEVVRGPLTDPELVEGFRTFASRHLGKGVVDAKDTVNFIANRIGVHGMMLTLHKALELGYGVREVDAITGPALGRPSSATFKTADLVGLDTLAHVAQNCLDNLPNDEDLAVFELPPQVATMIEKGLTGRKAGAGFYKKVGKDILTLNLESLEYENVPKPKIDSIKKAKGTDDVVQRIAGVIAADDRAGVFARAVVLRSLAYTARRMGEIADDVASIDDALRWGFNWELGPFELWEKLGVAKVNEWMEGEGIEVPALALEAAKTGSFYGDREVGSPTPLQRAKESDRVLKKAFSAHLLDLGDGVLGFEFHTKMNALDDSVVNELSDAMDLMESRSDVNGMVIANDGQNFSVGANIMLILMSINQQAWEQVEAMSKRFQNVFRRMHKSSKPVVAAPHNMALGGGAEICLGADRVRAHAELYMGLVEVGVGLIPGAGGTLELLKRHLEDVPVERDIVFDRFPWVARTFMAIGTAKVATSAHEALDLRFLRQRDAITFDRAQLVHDAKADVIHLASTGYRPDPDCDNLYLPGPDGAAAIGALLYSMETAGHISAHDRLIGDKLARVLTGGDTDGRKAVSEEAVLELEREVFLSLCGEELSKARIMHMLQTGKPLRN